MNKQKQAFSTFSTIEDNQMEAVTGAALGVKPLIAAGEEIHEGYTALKEGLTAAEPAFKYAGRTVHRWTKHAGGSFVGNLLHRWGKHI